MFPNKIIAFSACIVRLAMIMFALSSASETTEIDQEWDYEPRVWSLDEPILSQVGNNDDLEFDQYWDHDQTTDTSVGSESPQNNGKTEDPRKQHYFLANSKYQQNQQQHLSKKDECNQFRVDIREAVVCDKKRCDKFDFEWPKYDNQLTLIETTKHGMRFHRADFAFAPKSNRASRANYPSRENSDEYVVGSMTTLCPVVDATRVKFDILDLFKPPQSTTSPASTTAKFDIFDLFKPSSTTTTTTTATTTTTTTTTVGPTSSSPATSPSTETPTTANGQTTTPSGSGETATENNVNATRDRDIYSQDTNTTKLVTTFRLDTRRTKQKMVGFGGALSDSSCRNIKSLSPEMAKSLMEDYYGDRGIRYNLARLTIGSSDFSTTPYTNNDRNVATNKDDQISSSVNDDVEMNNFHLTSEDYNFKLPIARQAIATSRQELKFFASLWSPPIWMKNNSHIVHGYLKGDVYGPYYKALAELMLKWLEAYRKNGIEFWGLTGLNEPVTGVKPFIFHNSLGITRDDYITFLKLYLGPMLRRRGFQDTKLLVLDDNRGYAPFWVKALLEDQEAAKYVSGIAFHWYMNDEYENLNFIAKYHQDKFVLSTEACNGFLPFQTHVLPGNWDRGVAYIYDIIKMIQKNSVAWVDWNMALDLTGGPSWANNYLDAPIIVNSKRDEYYKSPMFYAIGHFSRFVESDSMRLDYRLANAMFDYPLEAVAFYTPKGYIVIVALNANKHQVPFKIVVDRQLVRIVTLREDSFNTIVFKWKNKVN